MAWLPLGVALLTMPVVAYATTTWLLIPKLQRDLGLRPAAAPGPETSEGESGKAGAPRAGGAAETVTLTKLIVNVSGTMGSRYLLTSLTLVGGGAGFKEKVEKNDAKLRDLACGLLSTKTISDLEKPGARNLVRSELLAGFNHILGAGTVQELYLTEFAIQ